jgi:hypothetical protein
MVGNPARQQSGLDTVKARITNDKWNAMDSQASDHGQTGSKKQATVVVRVVAVLVLYRCAKVARGVIRWGLEGPSPTGCYAHLDNAWFRGRSGRASAAFRRYLHFFNSYSETYGSLGAVMILMLWFYIAGLAFWWTDRSIRRSNMQQPNTATPKQSRSAEKPHRTPTKPLR